MSITVLVIDDSEDDQRLYQRAFKDFDYSTKLTMVSSAEEGFSRIADAKPDLILLDYNLPGMDGLSFMKKLAAHSDTRIPIVLLTGETSAVLAVEMMKHGADDYLVKDTEGRYLRQLPGVAVRVMATYAQQKEALRLRQNNEDLLLRDQALMQNSMDGIHVLDMQGNIVEANDAFGRILGYSREEVAGLNIIDWAVEFSSEELQARFQEHIGKSVMIETVHRRKNGTLINVEISVAGVAINGQGLLFCSSRDITERIQAEVALQNSEANLHAILDNLPYLAWLKDTQGRYMTINKVYADYLRLEDPEQAIGKTDLDLQPEELAKKYQADDAEVMATRQKKHVEESSFDGKSIHWVETYKTPILDAHGNVDGTVGLARDITERIRVENVIRESEQRLKSHIENTPMAVVSWDKNLTVTQWAGEAERMFGWTTAETIGKPLMDLKMIYEEDIPLVQETMGKVREAQRYVITPNRNITKDGRVIHCVWYNSVLSNKDGLMESVMSLVLDVTERKQIEKTLLESEKQYRSLFENMLDGITHCRMLFDHCVPQDFIYLNVNAQFEKITGLKDLVGKKVCEVIPGIRESNPELFDICGRVALTGQPEKFETHIESLGIWFSITVYSNIKEEFVAVFEDVTELKRTEQELIVLNNHLTHEVTKRTSELSALTAHVQDVAEKERAFLAQELHDQMGSNMAVAIMTIARIKDQVTDPNLLQDLSSVKELLSNTNRDMHQVVSQLYPTGLDNRGLIPAIEWLVQTYRKHSGIEVQIFLPDKHFVMEQTFELAAYRVTQECLTNIAKHAKASMVKIEIKVIDRFLDMLIYDNGIGLPDDIKTGGHGIFGMIERARYMGGSMEISSYGKGTTAHLRLPLAVVKPQNIKRVLLVDDHAIVRNALRDLLKSQTDDFSVEGEAADGKVALQMALDEEWDIILLDITLPKMNGLQVLEKIIDAKPNQPIIMLSSHSAEEYSEIALSKGASAYLEKTDTRELIETMRRATVTQTAETFRPLRS